MNAIARLDQIQGEPPVNGLAATPASSPTALPLSRSPHLVRMAGQAAELTRLYGRRALSQPVEGTVWLFRWRHLAQVLTGVELHLRIGGASAVIGLETLAAFGSATDVTSAAVPPGLRAAYLNGLGAAVWPLLERIVERPVEILEVRTDSLLEPTGEHLCFEIGPAQGPVVRGLVCLTETDPRRRRELAGVLSQTSLRRMPGPLLPDGLPLRWSAVLGITRLPASEVRGLEEHDIILIDDVRAAPNLLNGWLAAGPTRRYAGRLAWSSVGQLQMVQFGGGGEASMESNIKAVPEGFDDLPVSVRFELANWTASLAEVGNLAPGAVLDIGQRIDEHAITAWVEQRCIGKGHLVAIGERLGVRLVSVFAGLAPPESKLTDTQGLARHEADSPGPDTAASAARQAT